jgi:hypothetical protein
MPSQRFTEVFPRQLRFWSFHAGFNALPSLGIALGWMELWRVPSAVVGMLAAIGTFVVLYAVLTSLGRVFSDSASLWARAVRLGAKIRAWISGISLVMVGIPPLGIFTPDAWCGIAAIQAWNWLWRMAGQGGSFFDPMSSSNAKFHTVYLVTFTEGLLLSGLLFGICLIVLVIKAGDE